MKLKSLSRDNLLTNNEIQILGKINIDTAEQLISHANLEALSKLTNNSISFNKLKQIKKFIIGQYAPFPQPANEVLSKINRKLITLKCGCQRIDNLISGRDGNDFMLFQGGIRTGEITEITGATSTGKTEFCFNIIVDHLVNSKMNRELSCVYIDSNNNVCHKRLVHLFKNRFINDNIKIKSSLEAIKVIQCKSIFHLFDIIYDIENTSSSNSNISNKTPTIIVIDSLTSIFTSFKAGSYQNEINFYLKKISSHLKYLAVHFNIAIIMTTNSSQFENTLCSTSPFCLSSNFIIQSMTTMILYLRKTTLDEEENKIRRLIEVIKSNQCFLDNKICEFQITDNGLA
jgi:RecA/RadA recombinase